MTLAIFTFTIALISLVLNLINTSLFIQLIKYYKGSKPGRYQRDEIKEPHHELNDNEAVCFSLLKEVSHESVWATAIRNVIHSNDIPRFRRLICDLKSQANDNMDSMRTILGNKTLNAVMNL
jgi:hypothetical protein